MSFVVVLLFALLLVLIVRVSVPAREYGRVAAFLLAGYVIRLVLALLVMRSVSFFSHGVAGGDCLQYQAYAELIEKIWDTTGFHIITADEMPDMQQVSLVCHLFAMVNVLSGGSSVLGCTALVALTACGTALTVHAFAREIGATDDGAFRALLLTLFGPAFLYYTSDMYKDGLNAFLVLAAVFLAVRLARRFSPFDVLALVPLLLGLWFVRPYMVAMCLIPIGVGLLGVGRLNFRTLVMMLVMVLAGLVAFQLRAGASVVAQAQEQFDHGVDENVRNYNAEGGSGVAFNDGGSTFGALGPKMLYTVFSPFPWSTGSIGLQLGKLDTFAWYYVIWHGVRAFRRSWAENRGLAVTMLLFLGPGFFAYSLTMSNIGLIVRQRLPLVFVFVALAATEWARVDEVQSRQRTSTPRPGDLPDQAASG